MDYAALSSNQLRFASVFTSTVNWRLNAGAEHALLEQLACRVDMIWKRQLLFRITVWFNGNFNIVTFLL